MIPRAPKPYGLKRRLVMLSLAVMALAYGLGLVAFIGALEKRDSEAKNADAIVALTGGDARLDKAMELLVQGRGKRLLISGVHEDVTRDQLFIQLKSQSAAARRDVFDCCVDIGHGAGNTIGNAYEAAEWVRNNKYRSVILVTAAYHMPRSVMELSAAMPSIALVAQPVFPEDLETRNWWQDRQSAWVLLGEYTKYLFSWGRLSVLEPTGISFRPNATGQIEYGDAPPGQEPAHGVEAANLPGQ
jgi:uncharacterized SAM-binding protein YcdF (DUF218 family)